MEADSLVRLLRRRVADELPICELSGSGRYDDPSMSLAIVPNADLTDFP